VTNTKPVTSSRIWLALTRSFFFSPVLIDWAAAVGKLNLSGNVVTVETLAAINIMEGDTKRDEQNGAGGDATGRNRPVGIVH
jgi:hypothetical protein